MSVSAASKEPPKETPKFSIIPKIINGGIAGIIGVSVVFPIDLVKTRLQNQHIGPNGEKQYKNILDCFKKTYAAEGYFGMYRGSAVNIILITPEKAIKLTANDTFRFYLTRPDGMRVLERLVHEHSEGVHVLFVNVCLAYSTETQSLPIPYQMLAGGLAGAFQIIVTTPMELLKIQMQDQGRKESEAKAAGRSFQRITAMQLTTQIIKERGLFGLYKGLFATAARDISFSIIYFPLFATFNDLGIDLTTKKVPFVWSFGSGLTSGSIAALAVTPLDVIKTRMQASGSGEKKYTSMADCFAKTLKNEGPAAFFKGGICRMMVMAPLFGIAQSIYYIGIAERLLGLK